MIAPDLIPGSAPLSSVPGLHPAQIQALNDLWIDCAQQLTGIYGTTEQARLRLAAALRIERTSLDGIISLAQRLEPRSRTASGVALELEAAANEFPLGALLEDATVTAMRMASLPPYTAAVRGPLPESYSLLNQLPPVRSQGRRSTCVAHAVLSMREQMEIACGATYDFNLSEQYVYWWCKERDGIPGRNGTYLSLGMRCLKETGAPFEALWPYVQALSADQGQGPPPARAAAGDLAFATAETQEFSRSDIAGIKACLVEGRSLTFSLPVYDSWFKSSAMARWGKITMPLPGESVREGHAMAIVGYQDDRVAPGGGYFLLRNSWQPWAWDGVWQAGYGYIPYAYVTRYASAIFSAYRPAVARPFVRGEEAEGQPGLIVHSPDLWLRQTPDGATLPQVAAAGHENALYVRVTNPGSTYLYGVTGEVYFRRPDTIPWERAGQFTEASVRPGQTIIGPMAWLPPQAGKVHLAVRLV